MITTRNPSTRFEEWKIHHHDRQDQLQTYGKPQAVLRTVGASSQSVGRSGLRRSDAVHRCMGAGAAVVGEVFSELVGADALVNHDGDGKQSKSHESCAEQNPCVCEVPGVVSGLPDKSSTDQAEENCRTSPHTYRGTVSHQVLILWERDGQSVNTVFRVRIAKVVPRFLCQVSSWVAWRAPQTTSDRFIVRSHSRN
jgi:hypothetical protein